jgi:signal transduction histidine kinase
MPCGGQITISTQACREAAIPGSACGNAYLLVRVADTGQGMSPETIKRIFDPYFTTKGNTGTGLGVPQVQAFMQMVGGEIRVTSEPGTGTCFDLLFPAYDNVGPGLDNLWPQLDRWIDEGGAPVSVSGT